MKVECYIEQNNCPKDISEKITTLQYSSFFFTNFSHQLSTSHLRDSIYLLESVSKKFPATIIVTLKHEPVMYSIETADTTYFIGESGVVLPQQTTQEILSLKWKNDQPIVTDNVVNSEYHSIFLSVVASLEKLANKNPSISWISDTEILVEIPEEPPFIFDRETIETHIKKVGTIVNARELDEITQPILEIDMRFNLPVLRISQ